MKPTPNTTKATESAPLFGHANHLLFLLSAVLITAGLTLMTGESSKEAAFCPDIFSTTRTVIAPMVTFAGYLTMIAGILWRKKRMCQTE